MIDAKAQQEVAQRLHDSGVYFYRREREGGNVTGIIEVPWSAALVKIMQLTGWGVALQGTPEPYRELRIQPKGDSR